MRGKIAAIAAGTLLLLMAVNAFGGGIYGLAGADGVPPEWLHGSPFKSFFIPSLFLLLFVGGSSLAAAVLILKRSRYSRIAAIFTGLLLISRIAVQVIIIGYVSFLQPAVAIAGAVIAAMSPFLPSGDTGKK